jgi:hypothetical protein
VATAVLGACLVHAQNLKKMGKVDEETLLLLRDQFTALDADG